VGAGRQRAAPRHPAPWPGVRPVRRPPVVCIITFIHCWEKAILRSHVRTAWVGRVIIRGRGTLLVLLLFRRHSATQTLT
jgi:hypothetical protein